MILLLIGPSGSGKKSFKMACKNHGVRVIKSCTTKPKIDEKDEDVYQFLTEKQFDKLIKDDELLEWIVYNNNKYGTLRSDFTKNCVTIVDKEAIYKLKKIYSNKIFTIYFDISDEECRKRCLERGEDLKVIEQKFQQDKIRLGSFDKSMADLILHDDDLNKFDDIIKSHIKLWVVR